MWWWNHHLINIGAEVFLWIPFCLSPLIPTVSLAQKISEIKLLLSWTFPARLTISFFPGVTAVNMWLMGEKWSFCFDMSHAFCDVKIAKDRKEGFFLPFPAFPCWGSVCCCSEQDWPCCSDEMHWSANFVLALHQCSVLMPFEWVTSQEESCW